MTGFVVGSSLMGALVSSLSILFLGGDKFGRKTELIGAAGLYSKCNLSSMSSRSVHFTAPTKNSKCVLGSHSGVQSFYSVVCKCLPSLNSKTCQMPNPFVCTSCLMFCTRQWGVT
jgi:hypothetical protein